LAVAFRAAGFKRIGKAAQDLRNGLHLYSAPHLFAALHARNNTRLSQDREVT
jgi:hypothetical protein